MTVFVLGNGCSRESVDINTLQRLAPVYGCNAVYRTHVPDVLVATDQSIARAIQESGYALTHKFYTRRPRERSGALTIPQPYFGFSSGPVAVALAALQGFSRVYLLGFDLGPTADGKFNNVYAGTEFYKKPGAEPTYVGNWARQLRTICSNFSDTEFLRVHGPTTAEIEEFRTIPNLHKVGMLDFLNRINNPKDL